MVEGGGMNYGRCVMNYGMVGCMNYGGGGVYELWEGGGDQLCGVGVCKLWVGVV